ncbi:MmpS family transport accessory protein [Mycobacterium sp. ML4]
MTSRRAASILIATGTAFWASCAVAQADPFAPPGAFPKVHYEVSGTGMAEYISFQTQSGQQRAVNVPLPWSTDFQGFGGQVYVLSAQGQGTISCKIVLNGNVVNDAHSTGKPGMAICSH